MDSIDVSNRKPRRFKGTPAAKFRFYLSLAAVVYTLITGTLFIISPVDSELREVAQLQYEAKKQEDLELSEEEKLQRSAILHAFRHVTQAQKSDVINKTQDQDGR